MTTQVAPIQQFKADLAKYEDQLKTALPKHMSAERFSRVLLTMASRTPKVLDCNRASVFSALLVSAQLGLEPNGPGQHCYLIPYGKDCQFQLGYRGLLELARRSGKLKSIHAEVAYENDVFELELGSSEPRIIHKPLLSGSRGEIIAAYSVAKLDDGSTDFTWMTKEDIDKARRSNRGKSPAWDQWFSEMAKKVVMKRHLKTLPMSVDLQEKIEHDDQIFSASDEDGVIQTEGRKVYEEPTGEKERASFWSNVEGEDLEEYITDDIREKVKEATEEELEDILQLLRDLKANPVEGGDK